MTAQEKLEIDFPVRERKREREFSDERHSIYTDENIPFIIYKIICA